MGLQQLSFFSDSVTLFVICIILDFHSMAVFIPIAQQPVMSRVFHNRQSYMMGNIGSNCFRLAFDVSVRKLVLCIVGK